MSISVRKGIPSPIELQYQELKKQSLIDRNESQARNPHKERRADEVHDERMRSSSVQAEADDPTKRKPSQPVTADEMLALRTQFSIYA